MHKKAQVTLFVIIGIILLFGSALIISTARSTFEARLQSQAQETLLSSLEDTSINRYVTSCIQRVTSEGLLLLGEQGGVLYTDQGGLTNRSELIEGLDYFEFIKGFDDDLKPIKRNITYIVQKDVECPHFITSNFEINEYEEYKSYYPVKDVYFKDFGLVFGSFPEPLEFPGGCHSLTPSVSRSGFLGDNNLPSLCDKEGVNAELNEYGGFTCERSAYDSNQEPISIQEQLESYVEINIDSCVNLSVFEELGTEIILAEEETDVKIMFQNPDGLLISVYYPFNVQIGSKFVLTNAQFSDESTVNLKRLYYFISEVLFKHLQDPLFNIYKDWEDISPSYLDTFYLEHISNSCELLGCSFFHDDIWKIGDEASLIDGEEFEFIFAVKQRAPVLEFMHERGIQSVFFRSDGKFIDIDYQFQVNDEILFAPLGIDPDDDYLNYTYYGWKENYDVEFDYDCCFKEGLTGSLAGGWTHCNNVNEPDCSSCTLANYHECLTDINVEENNWTLSDEYIRTEQNASYQTDEGDAGYHNITIVLEDKDGLKDFQIIHILIYDFPKAILETKNPYDDIDNSYASIEDWFLFDGSKSQASVLAGGSISQFIYADDVDDFSILKSESCVGVEAMTCIPTLATNLNFLTLPNYESETSEVPKPMNDSLTNIFFTRFFDKQNNGFGTIPTYIEHILGLIVRQNVGGSILSSPLDEKTIQVSQCLPHGLNDEITKKAYPYSRDNDYDNVCCEPLPYEDSLKGGTFEDEGVECYSENSKMCYPYGENGLILFSPLDIAVYEPSKDGNFSLVDKNYIQTLIGEETANRYNDVFSLEYSQVCSGERGNVCSGDLTVGLEIFDNCADIIYDDYQFARCEGPDVGDFSSCQNNKLNLINQPTECVKYDGESFEAKFDIYPDGHANQELIEDGYCGFSSTFQLKLGTFDPGNDFECNPTCNEYGCTYNDLSECNCDRDLICDKYDANDFDVFGSEKFICVNEENVCFNDCEAISTSPDNSKEICYCAANGLENVPVLTSTTINMFFVDSIHNNLIYEPSNTYNSKCCLDGVYIHDGDKYRCENGDVLQFTGILSSDKKVLLNGINLIYCGDGSGWSPSHVASEDDFYIVNMVKYTCDGSIWAS